MKMAVKFGMSIQEFYKSNDRELYNFLEAKSEALREKREHEWDMARHIMWASVQPHVDKKLRPSEFIKLSTDGNRADLSDWENQELKKWNAKMDEGMTLVPLFPNKK
jgi:hypothetical protein